MGKGGRKEGRKGGREGGRKGGRAGQLPVTRKMQSQAGQAVMTVGKSWHGGGRARERELRVNSVNEPASDTAHVPCRLSILPPSLPPSLLSSLPGTNCSRAR
jgi:hypothetical protein